MSWNSSARMEAFAALIREHQIARLRAEAPNLIGMAKYGVVEIKAGRRWTRVDVNGAGKYMVDLDGAIYGIKSAYGVPHYGHQYGTLDTIHEWDWSGYTAVKRDQLAPSLA